MEQRYMLYIFSKNMYEGVNNRPPCFIFIHNEWLAKNHQFVFLPNWINQLKSKSSFDNKLRIYVCKIFKWVSCLTLCQQIMQFFLNRSTDLISSVKDSIHGGHWGDVLSGLRTGILVFPQAPMVARWRFDQGPRGLPDVCAPIWCDFFTKLCELCT